MSVANGRQRVVINNVSPCIEGGAYAAKATVNKSFTLSANIFADGHDIVEASVLMKHKSERTWKEFPLTPVGNDRWELHVTLVKEGLYHFKVHAWINHYITWLKGLEKKAGAGQDITQELIIGSELLAEAALHVKPRQQQILLNWSRHLKEMDPLIGVEYARNAELNQVLQLSRDKKLVSTSEQELWIEVERERAAFGAWYELFPRSAADAPGKHGTFNDVKRLLPRIAEMGFNILYFPPIHPIGEQKRKGRNNALTTQAGDPGSPWAIGNKLGGHTDIHPELGSLKDFLSLVKEAKKFNIEIALDIAFQCAPDHPYVKEHPEWFKWRPDGTVQYAENPPKRYEDILPFNFETEDWENLWETLKDVIAYWASKGVRIFRIDNPHTKALAFWEWTIAEIRKKYPDAIFLAEAFTRPRIMEQLARTGFTQSYTYFAWRSNKKELETYMKELLAEPMRYYFRPNFWPNTPDILTDELVHGGENAHIIRLILAATLSSSYGIYGPVYEYNINTPMPGKEEYTDNEKYEIRHWDWNRYTKTREIITRINRLRNEHPALQDTYNASIAETSDDHLFCYCKIDTKSGNRLIIVVNLDAHNERSGMVKIPLEPMGLAPNEAYQLRDLLSGEKYTWQQEWNFVKLNPYKMPAHIFYVEPKSIV